MADSHAQFSGNIPEIYDQHLGPAFFVAPETHIAKKIAEAVSTNEISITRQAIGLMRNSVK